MNSRHPLYWATAEARAADARRARRWQIAEACVPLLLAPLALGLTGYLLGYGAVAIVVRTVALIARFLSP